MKFFFEFVSCCGPACRSAVITTGAKPAEERCVPLYAASVPVESRRKQSRRAASRSGDWRPALNAISEDNVVVVAVERESRAAVGSERIMKKRKVSHSTSKVQVRKYSNHDFRQASFGGAMVPAFSPTPFFF